MRRFLISVVVAACAVVGTGCGGHTLVEVGTRTVGDTTFLEKRNLLMHVRSGKRNYFLLVGPDTSRGDQTARVELRCSTFSTRALEGLIYLVGQYPIGQTNNVIAAADGTTMVMELTDRFERVYLLAKDTAAERVTVRLAPGKSAAPGSKSSQQLQVMQYVQADLVDGLVRLGEPTPIPTTDGAIKDFLRKVNEARKDAGLDGWPVPDPWQ